MKRIRTIPLCTALLSCCLLMTGCGGTHNLQNAEQTGTQSAARTSVTRAAETTAARTSHAPAETTSRGVTTDARSRGTTTGSDLIDRAESEVRDAASDVQSAVTSVLTEATREVHPFDHE